jgi:gliding motility-associated-like protein
VYDPNGYTNDIFCPLHEGVTSYELQIYNKWGELLFISEDIHVGWNGYYRGELCKEDVYAWRATATFSNGTRVNKSGDVTLLIR